MRNLTLLLAGLFATYPLTVPATDACSNRAVVTEADVTVSDGDQYRVQTLFQSKQAVTLKMIRDTDVTIAIDGQTAWTRDDNELATGDAQTKVFALGHQFHAFVLAFDELAVNTKTVESLTFRGKSRRAVAGMLPGETPVYMIVEEAEGRPVGLRITLSDRDIDATFHEWRGTGAGDMPHRIEIYDEDRQFTYRFTKIEIEARSPDWYYDENGSPDIDAVQIYRLHRRQLIAHCLGDAKMLAATAAPEVVIASQGQVLRTTRDEMQQMFDGVFERRKYSEYVDVSPPIIEVSDSGDLGWAAVNIKTVGHSEPGEAPFNETWAWFMTARKIDGEWRFTGNASNAVPGRSG